MNRDFACTVSQADGHDPTAREYLGFDIGGTKSTVVLGKHDGSILASETIATDHNRQPREMIEALCRIGKRLAASAGRRPLVAAGMSCGGPLDSHQGVIYSPPNLPDWDAVPIVAIVQDTLGLPARLQNDANAGALAEWRFGAARGTRNMVFLTFGTGMGAGIILDGRLYSGTNDMAGEIGHIRMEKEGPVGYGKAGSFEGFCSGAGIARLAREIVAAEWRRGRATPFCRTEADRKGLDARTVGAAALAGDTTALHIIEMTAEYLGRGLAVLVDILNPEIIVIGSIFARLEPLIRPKMEATLSAEALPRANQVCKVVPAALGEDVGKLAALSVAMQIPFSNESAIESNNVSQMEAPDEYERT